MSSEESQDRSCCASGHVDAGTPIGISIVMDGVDTYFATARTSSVGVIVILTDVFGWTLVNARLLADKWAARGFDCYVPDLHAGDSLVPEKYDWIIAKPKGIFGSIGKGLKFVSSVPSLLLWLGRHKDEQTLPALDKFLASVRVKHSGSKLGVQGFCWGGRYAMLLAARSTGSDTRPCIDAAVACHPSNVKAPDDISPITKPTCFLLAGTDAMFPTAAIEKTKGLLAPGPKDGAYTHELYVFPGTEHGFAMRGDENIPAVAAARQDALDKAAAFFTKHLA